MEKFAVTIEETLSKTVVVEAEDWDSAAEKVYDAYYDTDIVLNLGSVDPKFIETEAYGRDPLPENSDVLEYYDFVG